MSRLSLVAGLLALCVFPSLVVAHVPPAGPIEEPPDAFCIVVIEPLDGFRQVRITVDENLTALAKRESFGLADANGDGLVNAQEGEGFRLSTLRFWSGGLGMGNKSLYLGPGAPYTEYTPVRPVYAVTWRHPGHGYYKDPISVHTGLAKNASVGFDQFETQAVREYAFSTPDGVSRISLHGGLQADTDRLRIDSNITYLPRPQPEYVVIQAPAGWQIQTVRGFGYNGSFELTGPKPRMEIRGFDTSARWSVDFVDPVLDKKLGYLGDPALGPMAVFGLLLAGAALAMRRR